MARIFSIVVANLTMDTLYEFRAVATAGNETSEGATLSFRLTSPLPPSPPYALLAGIGISVVATVGILSLVLRRRKRPPADPRLPVR